MSFFVVIPEAGSIWTGWQVYCDARCTALLWFLRLYCYDTSSNFRAKKRTIASSWRMMNDVLCVLIYSCSSNSDQRDEGLSFSIKYSLSIQTKEFLESTKFLEKKKPMFWDITLCSPLKFYRRFEKSCHLHLHGRSISQERNKLATCFSLVSCLVNSSNLEIEATCSSETSADFQLTTWRYIPEHEILHNHRCENLKCDKLLIWHVIWLRVLLNRIKAKR
jgi:hypothetical protein